MRMVGCVSPPTAGTLRLFGLDPAKHGPAIRARLGVVPQEDTLDQELPVRENLVDLRPLLRPVAQRRTRSRRRAARLRPARRPRRLQGRAAVRRHEAPADDRPVADQRPRAAAARRADHRARPAGAARRLGAAVPAQAAGRDPGAHHALHGRGRAAVRPARRHGRRPDRRRGLAGRAHRDALLPRGGRAAVPRRPARCTSPAPARASPTGSRCCPTGSCSTSTTATPPSRPLHSRGLHPTSVLVRRSTLEDVFLRLTGRTLVD